MTHTLWIVIIVILLGGDGKPPYIDIEVIGKPYMQFDKCDAAAKEIYDNNNPGPNVFIGCLAVEHDMIW